jgi:UDP-N-acetylglucosamine 2-epimerase (non-hydrolysing)
MKVLVVFGTRPEAIKMAPLVHRMRQEPEVFEVIVCVTGQHRHLLDQVLEIFGIAPDFDLNIMTPGQTLSDLTATILTKMSLILMKTRPDYVLVHGDTTTTFATALASFFLDIPVGHVEAGLRTNNLRSPFPEEFNRQAVSRLAHFHFAPTNLCAENLEKEGVLPERIAVTGNTVIDALNWTLDLIDSSQIAKDQTVNALRDLLHFDCQKTSYILITGHRRENFGSGFLEICHGLLELANRYPQIHFVYPVHLNPNVQTPVNEILSSLNNIHLIQPLDYLKFVFLLKHCLFVLTDSGGLQEEAPSLGKPVLLMRDTTERPEALEAGTIELVGATRELIIEGASRLLENPRHFEKMVNSINPFGDGHAVDAIVFQLKKL